MSTERTGVIHCSKEVDKDVYSEPSSTTSSSMMGINNYFIKNVKGKE